MGTIDPDGQHHLHISISDSEGATFGGHVWSNHIIYTTGKFSFSYVWLLVWVSAEIVIGTNENEKYSREDCKLSGWPELVIKNT